MAISRVRISKSATETFRSMERKTQITPNLLARLAIAMSFENKKPLDITPADSSGMELNYSTLYGEHELIYRHLAIQYAGDPKVDVDRELRLHLERGTPLLQEALATKEFFDLVPS